MTTNAKRLPPRPAIVLVLTCACGSTLRGRVSAPMTDAFKLRDMFLSHHRRAGCAVTDTSEDAMSTD